MLCNETHERWNNYYTIVIGPLTKIKVNRNISAEELMEKTKGMLERDIPLKAFREVLSYMSSYPSVTLVLNSSDNFTQHRLEKKSKNIYQNHFKSDAEFWI